MKSYRVALKYLDRLLREKYPHPASFKFPRILKALDYLGNPQNRFRSIHVGGTAGKGSTATLIASILEEADYKVGLYTSPYLVDLRERFQINGQYILSGDLALSTQEVKDAAKKVYTQTRFGHLTYLETLVLISFVYFAQKKVDFAVVEVGLGGEGDTTNVLQPEVSVITNVNLDHTEVLGKSTREIAQIKSGIIKPKTPLVTTAQGIILEIFQKKCQDTNSQLVNINQKKLKILKINKESTWFSYQNFRNLKLRLIGKFQAQNAALAIEVINVLNKKGYKISKNAIITGFKKAFLPGRFEIISKNKILDSAHNPLEISAFVESFQEIFPQQKCQLVLGFNPYNSEREFVRYLAKICSQVIITQFDPNSKLKTKFSKIYQAFQKYKIKTQIIKNPLLALKFAQKNRLPNEILAVNGSIFLASYLRKYLVDSKP